MRVIPVIDILNNTVVHAIRGKREEYKPVKSVLCENSNPIDVALMFRTHFRFKELYVADLNAIMMKSAFSNVYSQIKSQSDLTLMVDAGVKNIDEANRLFNGGVSKVIVGTETLENRNFIEQAILNFGANRIIVSLDLLNRTVLSSDPLLKFSDPFFAAQIIGNMGVKQIIVLDLAKVGSGEGVDVEFLKKIVDRFEYDVLVGGGIRNINDLTELRKIGISGALVATALHTGKITKEELESEGFI
jgi:phosphoribosylformimino-5-aminoimidazole carboxamide ribotide isomerase